MKKTKFYHNVFLYLALGLLIVLWGFSKSYFGKLGQTTLPYHVHGISATFWMLLLILQPLLYRQGFMKAHRYLGWVSVVVVPVLVFGGLEMMKLMINRQEQYPPDIVYRLAFIDAATLLGFVVLYVLAIYHRKRLQLHARFMVCTIFSPLNPALTRVFFSLHLASGFDEALMYSYILIELALLIIIWRERRSKEMRLTYLPVFYFMVIQHVLMKYAGNWDWWISLMDAFAGYQPL